MSKELKVDGRKNGTRFLILAPSSFIPNRLLPIVLNSTDRPLWVLGHDSWPSNLDLTRLSRRVKSEVDDQVSNWTALKT